MLKEAKKKLQKEIGENAGNPYIQVVGQFLLQHISAHPEDAEKILQKDKTISKSLNAMRKEAEKKKVGNCAVLTDQEGFEIVSRYFEINSAPVVTVTQQPEPEPTKTASFDISLEDLL